MESNEVSWGEFKNAELHSKFGFGFERVVEAIDDGCILGIRDHPNIVKYAHQKQMIVKIDGYAWVVPYVQQENRIFLKTMFPSRVGTKRLIGDIQ